MMLTILTIVNVTILALFTAAWLYFLRHWLALVAEGKHAKRIGP